VTATVVFIEMATWHKARGELSGDRQYQGLIFRLADRRAGADIGGAELDSQLISDFHEFVIRLVPAAFIDGIGVVRCPELSKRIGVELACLVKVGFCLPDLLVRDGMSAKRVVQLYDPADGWGCSVDCQVELTEGRAPLIGLTVDRILRAQVVIVFVPGIHEDPWCIIHTSRWLSHVSMTVHTGDALWAEPLNQLEKSACSIEERHATVVILLADQPALGFKPDGVPLYVGWAVMFDEEAERVARWGELPVGRDLVASPVRRPNDLSIVVLD
jgi:hypothetical protein